MKLTDIQEELYNIFLRNDFQVLVGIWSRQSGKSFLENNIIVNESVNKKTNILGYYYAPFLASGHLLNQTYHDLGYGNELIKESRQFVELRNGSTVYSAGYNSEKLDGNIYDLIIIDEFFYATESLIYEICHYSKTVPKCKFLLMGSIDNNKRQSLRNLEIIQEQMSIYKYLIHAQK